MDRIKSALRRLDRDDLCAEQKGEKVLLQRKLLDAERWLAEQRAYLDAVLPSELTMRAAAASASGSYNSYVESDEDDDEDDDGFGIGYSPLRGDGRSRSMEDIFDEEQDEHSSAESMDLDSESVPE